MITLDSIASLFGGSIPMWFWAIAAVVLAILLIVFGASSSSSSSKSYDKGDIKIGRESDGSYYAYEADTGDVLFSSDNKREVADFIAEAVR